MNGTQPFIPILSDPGRNRAHFLRLLQSASRHPLRQHPIQGPLKIGQKPQNTIAGSVDQPAVAAMV